MAKGKSSKSHHTPSSPSPARSRKFHRIANDSSLLRVAPSLKPLDVTPLVKAPALREVEDRRRFNFDGPRRPALQVSGRPARVVAVDRDRARPTTWTKVGAAKVRRAQYQVNRFGPKIVSQTKARLAFHIPRNVIVCIRRKVRREVMHALNKAGKGGMAPPKRNWLSRIGC